MRIRRLLAIPALLTSLLITITRAQPQPADDARPFPLMVGDSAPGLEVEWFKPGPVYTIEKGRPYVVEFWATWCGPCIRNIPHLTALQEKYKDTLTIVGVSVWEPRPHEVGAFVEKQGPQMGYCVAMDSVPPAPADVDNPSDWAKVHGKAAQAWLRASGWDWNGIPSSFIVDAQGRIAWAGNPRDLDEPLEAVVAGRWDIEAYKPQYRAERHAVLKAKPIYTRRRAALRAKDYDAYLKASDELLALGPSMSIYAAGTYQVLFTDLKDPGRANILARDVIERLGKDDRDALLELASVIVESRGDIDLALTAALRAEQITQGKDVTTLVSLAEIRAARTEFGRAVEALSKALAAARPDQREELQAKMKEYRSRSGN